MMKKVPKRRFKGFLNAGDWEQRKLKSIANMIVTGGDIDKNKIKESGTYPVIANALSKDGIVGYYDDSYRIEAPAVTVTGRGDIGVAKARHQNFTPVVRLLSLTTAHDVDFVEYAINNLKIVSESTGVPQLTVPQLSNYKIHITSIIEERKIGLFISKLDNLITLHQRKLEKLQATKKALLYELFPIENSRRPKLRFKGFTGDWEQRKLGDVVKRESVTQVSSTEYPAIEYEDVIPETGQLNKDIYKKGVQKAGILFDANKVLYGKLRPYLHNWVAPMYKGVAVGDWWVLNPCGLDRGFLYTLIQTVKFDTIANQSTGSKMPRADWKLLSTTEFSIPSLDEQIKIGKLVEGLNDYITLHQEESFLHKYML